MAVAGDRVELLGAIRVAASHTRHSLCHLAVHRISGGLHQLLKERVCLLERSPEGGDLAGIFGVFVGAFKKLEAHGRDHLQLGAHVESRQ